MREAVGWIAVMPRSTSRQRRLAVLVTLLGLVLGTSALLAPDAGAAGFTPISGSGSFWSSKALDQWRHGVNNLYDMAVNFSADGSTDGRDEFRDLLIETVPQPPPCDFTAALTQCATGTESATTLTATATTLEVSPGSPSAANTVQTLTATISPPGVAGVVQFKDGSGSIGGPVAVSGNSASTTTTLAPGTHSLTAVFTPSDPTGTHGSTSAAVSSVVSAAPGARATATAFMVTPSGPVIQGTPVILVAQVSPANTTGTVQFKDGDTELGIPRPVIGGFALTVTSKLTKGTHSLTAVFTPANQVAFGPSMPPPVLLTVIGLS